MFSPDTLRTLAALGIPLDDLAETGLGHGSEHQRRRGDQDGGRRDGVACAEADESGQAGR